MLGRILILAVFFSVGYVAMNRLHADSDAPRASGAQLVVSTQDLEVRFIRIGPISDSYMVFGGTNQKLRNSLTDVTLAGLAMRHARLLHQTYPDFHRCASPGAAQAQSYTETLSLVATSRGARKALSEAVDLHSRRIRSGGERTCVTLRGAALELDSIQLSRDGTDVTADFRAALRDTRFFAAEAAEVADCRALLEAPL